MKQFFLITGALLFLSACSETSEEHQESPKENILEAIVAEIQDALPTELETEEKAASRYHYDEDFEVFKTAVINKDIRGVSAFASSDNIDAEIIIEAFSDPDFLKQLTAATYHDLTTDTSGDDVLLVFSASMEGDDGEGNIFESGLYIYFSQGETSLLLENFLTAG